MGQIGRIEEDGVVAVVRLDDLSKATALTEALVAGGVRAVEFTFTNPAAARAIERVASDLGDRALIGAGSVLDAETARTAILAGAAYVVTPTVSARTIELCNRYAIPTVVGGLTPTELLSAQEAGAHYVKLFPASLGGPGYLKDVLGPLPQLRIVPTGGVTPTNAREYIEAGAVAVALGGNLVDRRLVAIEEWDEISLRARTAIEAVRAARAGR